MLIATHRRRRDRVLGHARRRAWTARYVFKRRRLSVALPRRHTAHGSCPARRELSPTSPAGRPAEFAHGLAAAYIGISVAFGHSIIRWADARVAHRFAGGPPPRRAPRHGAARARHEWREFGKAALAWAIASGLILAAIAIVGDPDRTAELQGWLARLTMVLGIWSLWPITYTLWPANRGRPRPGRA